MAASMQKLPLVLLILDGWGYSENTQYNAIAKAHTPQWDTWWSTRPHTLLQASGLTVGLPEGQMGNSEVGHMHMGAGRVVLQDFTKINDAIEKGQFATNTLCINTIKSLQDSGKALHIMGLLSPGGVHSHEEHLFALLALCDSQGFNRVHLHLFLDGRDTPPQSALQSLQLLKKILKQHPVATINSLSGRYYAMDRDHRWERIAPVYSLLTEGISNQKFNNAETAIEHYYHQGLSDEFIPPTVLGEACPLQDGDALLFFNFRADRARQLTATFVSPTFQGFQRSTQPRLSSFLSMTPYDEKLPTQALFPSSLLKNTLGEVLANQGLKQLRIAETEKYAHVTFFFNGGNEQVFAGEDRLLIPSPQIPTYDLQPEMNAPLLTDTLVKAIHSCQYDVIICNYANADMVGHSGNLTATIAAIECLDQCMQRVWDALQVHQGHLLITADHGNAEILFDPQTNQAHTAHTCQPVPLLYVGNQGQFNQATGSLIDIAPTILELLGITPPPEMTGAMLLDNYRV